MENLSEKPMLIYDSSLSSDIRLDEFMNLQPIEFDGYVFHKQFRDPKGNSGSNPTWGELYEIKNGIITNLGKGVYKEYDYDEPDGSYAEKLYSMLAKRVLDKQIRVPNITLVKDSKSKETGIFSHIILDNDTEDMMEIKALLFSVYDREKQKNMKSLVVYQDLLNAIKEEVHDEECFAKIEKQVVQTLLLDAFANNADRHARNWALIRDKETNEYNLGLFDHAVSFLDIISPRQLATNGTRWTNTYILTEEKKQIYGLGEDGKKVLKYLFKRYPEYSEEFIKNLEKELPGFLKEAKSMPGAIKSRSFESTLTAKCRGLRKILESQRSGEEYYD